MMLTMKRRATAAGRPGEESGAALVLALLATLVAVSLGLAVLALASTQLRLAANQQDGLKALDAADAGVSLAIDRLSRGDQPPPGDIELTPGVRYRVVLDAQAAGAATGQAQAGAPTAYQITADGYAGRAHRRVVAQVQVTAPANGGSGGTVEVLDWQETY